MDAMVTPRQKAQAFSIPFSGGGGGFGGGGGGSARTQKPPGKGRGPFKFLRKDEGHLACAAPSAADGSEDAHEQYSASRSHYREESRSLREAIANDMRKARAADPFATAVVAVPKRVPPNPSQHPSQQQPSSAAGSAPEDASGSSKSRQQSAAAAKRQKPQWNDSTEPEFQRGEPFQNDGRRHNTRDRGAEDEEPPEVGQTRRPREVGTLPTTAALDYRDAPSDADDGDDAPAPASRRDRKGDVRREADEYDGGGYERNSAHTRSPPKGTSAQLRQHEASVDEVRSGRRGMRDGTSYEGDEQHYSTSSRPTGARGGAPAATHEDPAHFRHAQEGKDDAGRRQPAYPARSSYDEHDEYGEDYHHQQPRREPTSGSRQQPSRQSSRFAPSRNPLPPQTGRDGAAPSMAETELMEQMEEEVRLAKEERLHYQKLKLQLAQERKEFDQSMYEAEQQLQNDREEWERTMQEERKQLRADRRGADEKHRLLQSQIDREREKSAKLEKEVSTLQLQLEKVTAQLQQSAKQHRVEVDRLRSECTALTNRNAELLAMTRDLQSRELEWKQQQQQRRTASTREWAAKSDDAADDGEAHLPPRGQSTGLSPPSDSEEYRSNGRSVSAESASAERDTGSDRHYDYHRGSASRRSKGDPSGGVAADAAAERARLAGERRAREIEERLRAEEEERQLRKERREQEAAQRKKREEEQQRRKRQEEEDASRKRQQDEEERKRQQVDRDLTAAAARNGSAVGGQQQRPLHSAPLNVMGSGASSTGGSASGSGVLRQGPPQLSKAAAVAAGLSAQPSSSDDSRVSRARGQQRPIPTAEMLIADNEPMPAEDVPGDVIVSHTPAVDPTGATGLGGSNKREILYKSGKKEVFYSNGTRKVVLRSGHVVLYFTNGDIKRTFPSGKSTYWYAAAQTTHTQLADGVQIFEFHSSGQTEKHSPDGTKEILYPDGIFKVIFPDRGEETHFPDGSCQVQAPP